MALTVNDLLNLKQMRKMELVAGAGGLNNIVVTSNLADYEFTPNINVSYHPPLFEAHSFVLSSLLYAKDNIELIYSSIERLYNYNVSAFAFKDVIFDTLPEEVIEFANENNFPIFKFSTDTYFENIIFEIMNAVKNDDNHYLQEENISAMIDNTMDRSQILAISKGLSIEFRKYVVGAFVKSKSEHSPLDIEYLQKLFLGSKELRKKAIISTYKGGLFILMTRDFDIMRGFEIILSEIMEYLSLKEDDILVSLSQPHKPQTNLDYCFRESYFCYMTNLSVKHKFKKYSDIGLYQLSLPLYKTREYKEYSNNLLEKLAKKEELLETLYAWIENQGNLPETAASLNCHLNTARNRIYQIKHILNMNDISEYQFFAILTPAVHYQLLSAE